MDVIDGQWIKSRLTGKRGEQASLARHLGISTDKLSKTISGGRNVQPEEVPLLLEFFNVRVAPAESEAEDLFRQIGRLNTDGQEVLRKHLDTLLGVPGLVRQDESSERGE